jgi:hypothetical protein
VSYLKVWSIALAALGPIEAQLGPDIRATIDMLRTVAPALAARGTASFVEPRFAAVLAGFFAAEPSEQDRLLTIMEAVLRLPAGSHSATTEHAVRTEEHGRGALSE